jgi:hypothetical protein
LLSGAASQERDSFHTTLEGNAVGVLTTVAFITFIVVYAIFGQRAAGIAFWAVIFGLPVLIAVVYALATVRRGRRRQELLEVATLAVRLAEQGAGNRKEATAPMNADVTRRLARDFPEDADV